MKTLFLIPRSLLVIFVAVLLLTCWLPIARGAVDLHPGYAVDIGGPVLVTAPADGPLSADSRNEIVGVLGYGPLVDWVVINTEDEAESVANIAAVIKATAVDLKTIRGRNDPPRIAFLMQALGWSITAAERDTAWAQLNGNGSSQ